MTSAEKRYRNELNLWDETLDGFEASEYSVPIFPRNKLILKKDGKKLLKHKITDPEGLYNQYKRRQVQYFESLVPMGLDGPVPDALPDMDTSNSGFSNMDLTGSSDMGTFDSFSFSFEESLEDTGSSFSMLDDNPNSEESSKIDESEGDSLQLFADNNPLFQNLWRPSQPEVEPRDHPLKNKYVKDEEKQQAIQYFGDEFLYTPDPSKDMEQGIVVERIGTNYYYLYKTKEPDWRLEYAQQLTTRV